MQVARVLVMLALAAGSMHALDQGGRSTYFEHRHLKESEQKKWNTVFLQEESAPLSLPSGEAVISAPGDVPLQAGAPSSYPQDLADGVPVGFYLPAVSAPALVRGLYRVTVPTGSSWLQIRVITSTPGVDVDLLVGYGDWPRLVSGEIVGADHYSIDPDGNERVTVTPASSPPLRYGTYYIALALWTLRTPVTGTVTARFGTGPPPRHHGVWLTPHLRASFSLPRVTTPTFFAVETAYWIEVPPGARRLTVRTFTDTPRADVDLYVRRNSESELRAGAVVADCKSEGPTGDELCVFTSPAAGVYFINLGLMPGPATPTTGTVMAIVEAPLTAGVATVFTLGPVTEETLWPNWWIRVPGNIWELEVSITSSTPGVDVDLYVRFGAPPAVTGGQVIADWRSTGFRGDEGITIRGSPLPEGDYYIGLGLFTAGRVATGWITTRLVEQPRLATVVEFRNAAAPALPPGVVAGSLAVGTVRGIAPTLRGCVSAPTLLGPLPTRLAEVEVQFGHHMAPIWSVCNIDGRETVTVQTPFELGVGVVPIEIRSGTRVIASGSAPVHWAQPGIFEVTFGGVPYGLVVKEDGTIASPTNPVRRRETVTMYTTGLGPVIPLGRTNQLGKEGQRVYYGVVVEINKARAEVIKAEYAAHLIGVYAVTFVVPADAPAGASIPLDIAVVLPDRSSVSGNGSRIAISW